MSRESPVNITAIMKKQMSEINQRLAQNVERQLLVLSYLESLDAAPASKRPKRAASAMELEDGVAEDAPAPVTIADDATLPRQASKYAGWKKELMLELLHYVCPRSFPLHKTVCDSVSTLRQILEYAFDVCAVEVEGRKSDRPCGNNKKAVFDRLCHLHAALGSRLHSLKLVDGNVSWPESGIYTVEMTQLQGLSKIRVTEKWSGRTCIIGDDLVPEECRTLIFANSDILHNYSKNGAALKFPQGQQLRLVTFVPDFAIETFDPQIQ